MLSEAEKKKEVQQWGMIYNIARQRRSLSELEYSPEEKIVNRMIEKIQEQILELKNR